MKRTRWVTATLASIAALALSGAYQPVAAQKGGHGGGGGGGGGGASAGGGAVGGGGISGGGSTRSGGGGSFNSGGRAFTGSAPRSSMNRGHVSGRGSISDGDRRHVRRFRHGRSFGYVPYGYYDDTYAYGGCGYYYRRAVATGSSYWWNRYYNCVGD